MDTSIVIAAAFGLFFVVTLPQLLARHAEDSDRAEVDLVPEDLQPVPASPAVVRGEPGPSTAPLLPRAIPAAKVSGGAETAAVPASAEAPAAASAEGPPQLMVLQGGRESARRNVQDVLDARLFHDAQVSLAEQVSAQPERMLLPLASGERHPATHVANATEFTAMSSSSTPGPSKTPGSAGTQDAGPQGPARRPGQAPRLPRSTAAGDRHASQRVSPGSAQPRAGRGPSATAPGNDDRGRADARPAIGRGVPRRRRSPLLPVFGIMVLLGAPATLVLALFAGFAVLSWSVPAAVALLTVLALFGVRMLNTTAGARRSERSASYEEPLVRETRAPRREIVVERQPGSERAASREESRRTVAASRHGVSRTESIDRDALRKAARTTAGSEHDTTVIGDLSEGPMASGLPEDAAPAAQDAPVSKRHEPRAMAPAGPRPSRSVDADSATPGTDAESAAPESTRESAAGQSDAAASGVPAEERGEREAHGKRSRQLVGEPVSFDELLIEERPAQHSASTWTPRQLPTPTYVDAPRASANEPGGAAGRGDAAERGSADASLAEALAMEFAAEPGSRPEVDPLLAHGRTATKAGKAEPGAEQHVNKAIKSAADLDSVLQRRRA